MATALSDNEIQATLKSAFAPRKCDVQIDEGGERLWFSILDESGKGLECAAVGADLHWHDGHKAVAFTVIGELPGKPGCKWDFEIHLTSRDILADTGTRDAEVRESVAVPA